MSKSKQKKILVSLGRKSLVIRLWPTDYSQLIQPYLCEEGAPKPGKKAFAAAIWIHIFVWVASFFCYDQNKAKRPAVLGEKKKEWQCSAVKHCMCYCFQFGRSWIQIVKLLTKRSHATNSQTHSKSAKSSMKCFSLNPPPQSSQEGYVSQSGAYVSKMAVFWKSFGKTKHPKSFLSVPISLQRVEVGRSFGERPTVPLHPPPLRPVSVRIIR